MIAAGQAVWAYELGNEVNNQGVGQDGSPDAHNCSIQPESQADGISRLGALISRLYPEASSRPKLIGSDLPWADMLSIC